MRVNEFFDAVFVLNLKKRFDRLIDTMKELERVGIRAEIIEAIDGNNLDLPETLSLDGLKISNGDIGCALSHRKACLTAKEKGLNNYLVLEDDVQFAFNFYEQFENYLRQTPMDYDMLYLGGSHNGETSTVSKNIVRGESIFTTHAIGIRSTIYDALIEVWSKHEKVDISAASLHSKYKCYAFNPFIVGQRPSYSDILNKHTDYKHLRV